MPALPVIANIFAVEISLFLDANSFRNFNSLSTLIILFLYFFKFLEEIMPLAPLFRASLINSDPLQFLPFIVKNKFPFLISLVSIERP